MPMMRRGPLDRYPAESVLRQASAHQVTGGLEFHSEAPATFYFSNGRVYAASAGVDLGPEGPDVGPTDEVSARREAVTLLAASLGSSTGWYYHDPLTRHRALGEWDWDTASLIMESRSHRPAPPEAPAPPAGQPPAPPPAAAAADHTVTLQTATSSVTLGADAWALVVALAGTSTTAELAEQLGWEPQRVGDTQRELQEQGLLAEAAPSRPDEPPAPPVSPLTVPAGALGVSGNGRHVGPLTPPPTIEAAPPATQRRRRRRR